MIKRSLAVVVGVVCALTWVGAFDFSSPGDALQHSRIARIPAWEFAMGRSHGLTTSSWGLRANLVSRRRVDFAGHPGRTAPVQLSVVQSDVKSKVSRRRVSTANWLVYHGSISGAGFRSSREPWRTRLTIGWRSNAVRGQIYGEPLVDHGVIYVATEEDFLYAFNLRTGAILWSQRVANSVSVVGDGICGDISPYLGITSTPVIDLKRNEIFVVAATARRGFLTHRLFGVNLRSHRVELNVAIDPPYGTPGFSKVSFDGFELQRAALTLDHGEVVVSFGGNWGDCGTYHGFLVEVQAANGHHSMYVMNHGAGNQDALWMGGAAPIVDRSGSIWVTSGNGSSHSLYDQSNTVLRLSSKLSVIGSFYPRNFAQLSSSDLDLGSGAPILLPDVGRGGSVLQVGKQGTGYLLPADLDNGLHGGARGAREVTHVGELCGDYGGAAVVSATVQSTSISHAMLKVCYGSTSPRQGAFSQCGRK